MKYSIFLGVYVPVTMEGNIIIDGVLASCYPSGHHDVSHVTMAPMRWFPEIIEWIFGENKGVQVYVSIAEDLGGWLLSNHQ